MATTVPTARATELRTSRSPSPRSPWGGEDRRAGMTVGTSVLRRQDDRRVGETPAVRTGPVRIAGGDGDQVKVRDDVDGLPSVTAGEVRRVTVGSSSHHCQPYPASAFGVPSAPVVEARM